MKVIEISDDLNQGGGVNSFVFDLSYALQKAGCQVLTIGILKSNNDYNPGIIELKSVGVQVEILSAENKTDALLHYVSTLRQIIVDFSEGEKVICNLHLKLSTLMGCLATIGLSNIMAVETYHNTYHHYHLQCFVQRPFISKYICVSEEARKEIIRRFHTKPEKTIAIPNGVPREKIRSNVTEAKNGGDENNQTHIVSIGRLSYEKNFITAVTALKGFCDNKITYTLVGGGPQYDEISKIASGNINIHILGKQSRQTCLEILSQADIVLMPSLWEGRSILQLEAAAFDVPMILSDVPGLREPFGEKGLSLNEDFRPCGFGYLVKTNDVEAYQKAIRHFCASSNTDIEGMKKIVKAFSLDNDISFVAQKYISLFKLVLEEQVT